MENIAYADLGYLKNIFLKQEVISAEMDGNNISYDIENKNLWIIKNEGNVFQSSYLDNNNISDLIDGVWIIVANEDSFPKIKSKQLYYHDGEEAKNMIYKRNQASLFKQLIHDLSVNSYESVDFIQHIKDHKKLPD
ncbi:hypothetical protein ACK6V9_16190 [Proteus mirabilis]|uniref:hypothetical protein n=1 Tax=Proteus mirabilis TaxID=584 RepID=UPI002578D7E8|nr:hypothetical protein [Proteus mirabilis]MDM3841390.1 hypothetical protein [Proteus mirabilis]